MKENRDAEGNGGFAAGQALELVAYQAGAVVSREIVKKPTGTVTAFAFDKGQGLSEHTAPFDALVHVVDGTAEIAIGGAPRRCGAGDLVLMPANVPHALHAVERFKMLLIMIRSA
ncbi:MAG TPA: cupin domain-containing protein [Polyangia bacterium]|nr:cupin domain-containing protein [Polyangia bacterium]